MRSLHVVSSLREIAPEHNQASVSHRLDVHAIAKALKRE